ncbi:hypothetical protein BS78_05G014600 [Paspalum vaginatum]|nr:hypothetical protein BS78_05G014600 [Paspalum vaginatum]
MVQSRSVLRGCVGGSSWDTGLYDTGLSPSGPWNLVSDKQLIQEEQPLQFHHRREEPRGTQAWRNRYSDMNT